MNALKTGGGATAFAPDSPDGAPAGPAPGAGGGACLSETCHGRWMGHQYEPGLVSIIVPTYNRGWLIGETLDSVLAQTYRPIELVVIDDGSTDDSRGVVERWRRKCAGARGLALRYRYQQNRGVSAAMNLGFIVSSGEYVQVLGSDDLLHPGKLSRQVAALSADPELDLVYSGSAVFRDEPDWEAKPRAGRPSGDLLADAVASVPWTAESALYRRALALANGPLAEDVSKWQDWEYTIRLLARKPKVGRVSGVLSLVREHDGGRVSDLTLTAAGARSMLRAACRAHGDLSAGALQTERTRRALASRYFLIAYCACVARLPALAREAGRRGLTLRAGAVKWLEFQAIALAASLPSSWGAGLCRVASSIVSMIMGQD